jgi:hypothetical protein
LAITNEKENKVSINAVSKILILFI